jgi:predicted nucleic acid-binding protein
MAVFVDTSAILPLLNSRQSHHQLIAATWDRLVLTEEDLITHNYVVVETHALVTNRLGLAAVRDFVETIAPLMSIDWVDTTLHAVAESMVLTANRRQLSLVDCVSFAFMRQRGLTRALTLDPQFAEQGFTCLP